MAPLLGKDSSSTSYKTFNFTTHVIRVSSMEGILYLRLIVLSQRSNFTFHRLQGHLYYGRKSLNDHLAVSEITLHEKEDIPLLSQLSPNTDHLSLTLSLSGVLSFPYKGNVWCPKVQQPNACTRSTTCSRCPGRLT